MARQGLLESNERKKKLVKRFAERRKQLKILAMDRSASLEQRLESFLKLSELPRNSSRVRVRSRCVKSGRPRGFYRFCGLSRIALREEASHGRMPGMRRSSW